MSRTPSEVSMDGAPHDLWQYQHREQRFRMRRHLLTIQGNNLQNAIREAMAFTDDGRVDDERMVELYQEHVPDVPIMGEYQRGDTITVLTAEGGEFTYVLVEPQSSFRFTTLIGLHGFRPCRMATRLEQDLSPEEYRQRVRNLYRYYCTV